MGLWLVIEFSGCHKTDNSFLISQNLLRTPISDINQSHHVKGQLSIFVLAGTPPPPPALLAVNLTVSPQDK